MKKRPLGTLAQCDSIARATFTTIDLREQKKKKTLFWTTPKKAAPGCCEALSLTRAIACIKAASLTVLHSALLAWRTYYFLPSCSFVATSQRGWDHKRQTKKQWPRVMRFRRSERRTRLIVFVCLFYAWPLLLTDVSLTVWGWLFTSVYLDSQAVVVWIWITDPFFFSHSPSGDAGRQLLWLQYIVALERHLVRSTWPVRLISSVRLSILSWIPLQLTLDIVHSSAPRE